jgi:hypothetical protein
VFLRKSFVAVFCRAALTGYGRTKGRVIDGYFPIQTGEMMKISYLRMIVLGCALTLAWSGMPRAQDSAKQDMKDAGHDTKSAAKHTGRAVKKTAKKATHKAAHKTRKAAGKVEQKTEPQP